MADRETLFPFEPTKDLPNSEDQTDTFFAEVILPLPLPRLFTYRVPRDLNYLVQVGSRVVVQFGKKKVLTAIVYQLHNTPPKDYQAKYLLELLDELPVANRYQLKLFGWMAEYYMCTLGEVMNAALPSGLKLSSESRIQFNPDFDYEQHKTNLEPNAKILLEALRENDSLSYDEASEVIGTGSIYKLLKTLIAHRAIILFEEVKEKYRPRIIKKVRLRPEVFSTAEKLEQVFETLKKSVRQQELLLTYLKKIPVLTEPDSNSFGLEKAELLGNIPANRSALSNLVSKHIFEEFEITVSRFGLLENKEQVEVELSAMQQMARENIVNLFNSKDFVLLHGITGSGKTEIYINLIQQVLATGSQVLFLLPEIALTTQIVGRLVRVFGNSVGVYHSRFSDNERVEVYRGVQEGRFQFVVGVRSSIFLPFDNLGLIIVDEEHEGSYKQQDPAPRYNARDMAGVLALFHHAKLLLGSATPSFETSYQARSGKWGLVELKERYGNATLPDIKTIDLKAERQAKTMKNNFSSELLAAIENAFNLGEQTILFQNRRGYAPYLNCLDCGWIPKCINCDVSLTYHLKANELRCHYCGHHEDVPKTCPSCKSSRIKSVGYGTEKIEEELQLILPNLSVARMDLDTTRKKNSFNELIEDFENGKINVLVGTQMVSKGLDFDKVSLVGIFDIDRMIHFPDFRSHERTFQLITQVSGRAGRREKRGLVLIQTTKPDHFLLQLVKDHNYNALYETEIVEREKYFFPPFARLIKLTVKHEEEDVVQQAAKYLAEKLKAQLSAPRVLGPEAPLIVRIRNLFLQDILVKLDRDTANLKAIKQLIINEVAEMLSKPEFKKVQVSTDVDPA